ncbi:MAG: Bax inhibitor-1/YccA family protein [Candidatus Kapaibacteriales bacterium]
MFNYQREKVGDRGLSANQHGQLSFGSLGFKSESDLAKSRADFMSKVYTWMTGGLLLTAGVSWWVMNSELVYAIGQYYWIIALATIGLVFFISARIEKMSATTAMGSFLLYAAVNGLLMGVLVSAFSTAAITNAFLVTAGSFAALSFYGYTTKKDLSGIGRFMFIGLVGIIIASVVNFFIGSSALDWTITVIGVVVFAGLTAYDTQRLRDMHDVMKLGKDIATKSAILGALALYLDFINLFIFFLRIFGGRD